MTSFVFRETLMSHLLIWGNAYAQIVRNGKGEVLSLYPLLPNKMSVERDSNGVLYYVYSRYSDENPNMKKMGDITLRQEDVLHIPGLGFDGLIGYSPIAMARNAVGMTMACEEYGASFFANGANPGGVLEHPGVLKDPAKVRDSWNAVYRGTTNAHKIAVLEERMKYQQIGIPPEEAQFLETRKIQINEIARLFRIPPHMVGDLEKSSFSNIEQQSLEFVKYTLDPWVIRWENNGKVQSYYISENHEPIVSPEVWEKVQEVREQRKRDRNIGQDSTMKFQNRYPLSGMLICPYCGKTLRRRQVYKKKIQWLCSTYIEKGVKACKGIRIDDAELQGLNITEQTVIEEVVKNGKKHYCYISKADFDCGIRNSTVSAEIEDGGVLPSVNRPRRTVIKL